jgi:hypothetical protein
MPFPPSLPQARDSRPSAIINHHKLMALVFCSFNHLPKVDTNLPSTARMEVLKYVQSEAATPIPILRKWFLHPMLTRHGRSILCWPVIGAPDQPMWWAGSERADAALAHRETDHGRAHKPAVTGLSAHKPAMTGLISPSTALRCLQYGFRHQRRWGSESKVEHPQRRCRAHGGARPSRGESRSNLYKVMFSFSFFDL